MDREKYVDESWKESAELEKTKLKATVGGESRKPSSTTPQSSTTDQNQPSSHSAESTAQPMSQSEPEGESHESSMDFLNYLSSLAYQVMIFLGEIPNPMTNMPEANVEQAKFIIDTLTVLREKTKGNLSKKENDFLNGSLYQLQMKYVELYQKQGAA